MLRALLVISFGLMLQGCIATMTLWQKPALGTVNEPRLIGLASDSKDPAHCQQYLLVGYTNVWFIFDGAQVIKYNYAIPLEDGHVPSPLHYTSSFRSQEEILNHLSQDDLNRIRQYRFGWRAWRLGSSLLNKGNVIHSNASESGVFSYPFWRTIGRHSYSPKTPPAQVLSWWWGSEIDPKQRQQMLKDAKLPGSRDKEMMPDAPAHILILPRQQRRFLTERAQSLGIAIIMTPAALAVDTVLLPTIVIFELAKAGFK